MSKKVVAVAPEVCSGCKNCELWCSLKKGRGGEFNPGFSIIKVIRDDKNANHSIFIDTDCCECSLNGIGEPICVEMCPTGTIVYTDFNDAIKKRMEMNDKKERQPLFKLIAPWKYPYPWTDFEKE
jgi:Fe-S-cluster-containing dehydrogenase component